MVNSWMGDQMLLEAVLGGKLGTFFPLVLRSNAQGSDGKITLCRLPSFGWDIKQVSCLTVVIKYTGKIPNLAGVCHSSSLHLVQIGCCASPKWVGATYWW
jgi:hypothetical protein